MDKARYLFPSDYMADPSANVFNGRLYIYPSHDWDSGEAFDDDGGHFQMKDYHVLSLEDVENGEVTDHGEVLAVKDIPWASRQLWDNDVVEKDGKYYMVYCAKDKNGVFHLGIAVSDCPEGPFTPQADPIRGSYSIDPCVFKDDDGAIYTYFGGIWGGQLQRYKDNQALGVEHLPEGDEPALPSRVARMTDDMLQFAEEPRAVLVVDDNGEPLKASDPHRFFEASWMHKMNGKYYFSAQDERKVLFFLFYWRHSLSVLRRGRQPLRPVHIQGGNPRACSRLDYAPLNRGIQRQVVPVPPRLCAV